MKSLTKKRSGQLLEAKIRGLLAVFAAMFIAAIFSITLLGCGGGGGNVSKLNGTWVYDGGGQRRRYICL
jgi:uncharacterized membrane protein